MAVTRSWACLNRNCKHEFDSGLEAPLCPSCGGSPCKWVPKAVNIGKVAPSIDNNLARLASEHKFSNLVSAKEGEQARPQPAYASAGDVTQVVQTPFGGVSAPMDMTRVSARPFTAPRSGTCAVKDGPRGGSFSNLPKLVPQITHR